MPDDVRVLTPLTDHETLRSRLPRMDVAAGPARIVMGYCTSSGGNEKPLMMACTYCGRETCGAPASSCEGCGASKWRSVKKTIDSRSGWS